MKLVGVARQLLQSEAPHDLFSLDRLVLLLYLVDWKAALAQDGAIEGLTWSVTRSGLTMSSESVNDGTIELLQRLDGAVTTAQAVASLPRSDDEAPLDEAEQRVVSFVRQAGSGRSWESLLALVLSTEPLLASHRNVLDLDRSAAERREAVGHLEPA